MNTWNLYNMLKYLIYVRTKKITCAKDKRLRAAKRSGEHECSKIINRMILHHQLFRAPKSSVRTRVQSCFKYTISWRLRTWYWTVRYILLDHRPYEISLVLREIRSYLIACRTGKKLLFTFSYKKTHVLRFIIKIFSGKRAINAMSFF